MKKVTDNVWCACVRTSSFMPLVYGKSFPFGMGSFRVRTACSTVPATDRVRVQFWLPYNFTGCFFSNVNCDSGALPSATSTTKSSERAQPTRMLPLCVCCFE